MQSRRPDSRRRATAPQPDRSLDRAPRSAPTGARQIPPREALRFLRFLATLAASIAVAPTPVPLSGADGAQSGPEILQTAQARYIERVAEIDDYTVVQEVGGTPATVHYEKRTVDGFLVFVPVSMFTVLQERIDAQKMSFLEGAVKAGLQSLLSEVSHASYGQMGNLLSALTDVGSSVLGSPSDISGSPVENVREVLARGAAQAGLKQAAEQLASAGAGQIGTLAGSLAGLGDGSILGQLGKIALGQAKNLAMKSLTAGAGAPLAGMAGLAPGAASGIGPGALGGAAGAGLGPQAMGALAKAGLSALTGGLTAMVTSAMMPDIGRIDEAAGRLAGPDVHDLMRRIGQNVRVAGSTVIEGHAAWTLEVTDLAALRLPDADEFTPSRVALEIDKSEYVLRRATVAGEVQADGKRVPVTMETRLEDYREVDGLLHPFRSATVIRGIDQTMSEADRKAMTGMPAEIEAKLKEAQASLAKLPPEQRKMAEQALAQQMPQFAQMMTRMAAMAEPELVDATVVVREVVVNRGRPEALQMWPPTR